MKFSNATTTTTAYDILGIAPNAPQRDVHTALRKLALAWHPDRVPNWRRGEATLRFQSIMDAYNKIRTPESRMDYDRSLQAKGVPLVKKAVSIAMNDNLPFGTKAKAWFKALETVFWPMRGK